MKIQAKKSTGRFWAFLPAGLLVGLLGTQVAFLAHSLDDPSFSVEEDYYEKALSWDAKMAQDKENQRLGWRLEFAVEHASEDVPVVLRVTAPDDTGVSSADVRVEAFHNARASRVVNARLQESRAGEYRATLPLARPGLWEFRTRIERGADVFVAAERVEVFEEKVRR